MKHFQQSARVGCGLLLGTTLLVRALPVSAQPGGVCSLISDDALTQALGSPAHAIGILSGNTAGAANGPTVADMCIGQFGSQNALQITHVVGVQTPGDVSNTLATTQGVAGAAGAALGGAVDPSALTTTPISNLGDSAVLLTAGGSYANLMVWRGSDSFQIVGAGLTDAQTSLTAVAQAILAGQP